MAITGQLGAMFSTVLMLGTRLTKEPLFEYYWSPQQMGRDSMVNYVLTLKAFPKRYYVITSAPIIG